MSINIPKIAQKIYADYVYDPEHRNKPQGGNWKQTPKGWSDVKEKSVSEVKVDSPKSDLTLKRDGNYTPEEKTVLRQKIKDTVKGQLKSPQFKAWFGKSKVVNSNGVPKVLFHGTTHDFSEFKKDRGAMENYFGIGFYFSDDPKDVSSNYATEEGADLRNRIEGKMDEISRGWEEEDGRDKIIERFKLTEEQIETLNNNPYDSFLTKELALRELSGGAPNIMPVYVKMENPIYIGTENNTQLFVEPDTEYYRDMAKDELNRDDYNDDEEYENALEEKANDLYYEDYDPKEVGSASDLKKAVVEVLGREGIEYDKYIEKLQEGISAQEFDDMLRDDYKLTDHMNDMGDMDGMEIIRSIYEEAGYDGVIMDAYNKFGGGSGRRTPMKMEKGTKHYIVFNPLQIKSALGNNGDFNPNNPNITASAQPIRKKPDYGTESDIMHQLADHAGIDLDKEQDSKTAIEFNYQRRT